MTHATLSTEPLPTDDPGTGQDPDAELDPGAGPDIDAESDSDAELDSGAEDGSDLQLAGGTLDDEELAAVTALLGTLAGASGTEGSGAGTAGPADRTLQRRRRLGLWGRPGPDSWKHAAGLR